jgi:hypothetical protein
MGNFETIVIAFLSFLSLASIVIFVTVFMLLRQIHQSVETFTAEFRKNANMQSKTFDRNLAETNGELKKISYRLDNMSEHLHRIEDFYIDGTKTQDSKKRGGSGI